MSEKILGIITARGGSKSVPRKSVLEAGGKPLIAWTIQAAKRSKSLDRLLVSTDDDEIAEVSRKFGAEVPFMRPAELARDDSPHMDVLLHALSWLEKNDNYVPDFIILLQPTSPLRMAEDIDAAVKTMRDKNADAAQSVYLDSNHAWDEFVKGSRGYVRRQDVKGRYVLNGAVYVIRRSVLLKEKTLFPDNSTPYVMPPDRSLDVDTPWDMHVARLLLESPFSG